MRRACRGDRGAYGRLVVLYQDRLFNSMLRLIGNGEDAKDLTQEAFTRGLAQLDTFRGDASPYTWLFRIALNLGINALRRGARQRTFSLDGGAGLSEAGPQIASDRRSGRSAGAKPGDQIEQRETHQQVVAALGRIDPDYRAVLVLRDIEGRDYQEISDLLDLPLGTVKSRLFRARLALRDELASLFKERNR